MPLSSLGIDISKDKFDVALWHAEKMRHHLFANNTSGFAALRTWLAKQGVTEVQACLEATGTYGEALALDLHTAGHRVSIVNPAQIRAYGQSELSRTKTDKTDAALMARFCQSQQPPAWTPPPPEVRELQALLRRLASLQEMRQMEMNRLASGVATARVSDSLQESITFLDGEIRKIERALREHVERHPDLKKQTELLQTIKGIGDKTALFLLAEFPAVQQFESARAMAAFAGVTPHRRESGTSVHGRTHLSKIGSARIRKALYWPAISAMRHNPIVRTFCERLRTRGKSEMSLIGAAMRKLIHIVYGVLKSGRSFDPNYGTKLTLDN